MPAMVHFVKTSNTQSSIFIMIPILVTIFAATCVNLIFILVITWVTKLKDLCTSTKTMQDFNIARHCLILYMEVEKGFGAYFLVLLSAHQLLLCTYLFLAFSSAADGLNDASSVFPFLCYSTNVFATLLQVVIFVFCLDSCHKSLRVLSAELQTEVLSMPPGRAKEEAQWLVQVKLLFLSLVIIMFRNWRAPDP